MLGPGWGIAIDLTATSAPLPAAQAGGGPSRVSGRVSLDVAPVLRHPPTDRTGLRLTPDEADWLRHGLTLTAARIEAALPPGERTLVTVHRVLFPGTDFQEEGLAGAIMAWAEAEFDLPTPTATTATTAATTAAPGSPEVPPDVSFDPVRNRFVYAWQDHDARREPRGGVPLRPVRRVRPARDLLGRPT
ncbi:hypothetical protein [Streptomyces sp. G45]|uniref:hypothetical protein n=1 Tax=Streptomyces sp. G45 TaxID=3406627 RepID=UPI003C22D50D